MKVIERLVRVQNLFIILLFILSSLLAFRFMGNLRLLSATSVDEYWVGAQGMSTLSIWPSLNSPENELAYGDFPSGLVLTLIKGLGAIGLEQGQYSIYIIVYRLLSVLALFGIYVVLLRYPNDFDSQVWKMSVTFVVLLGLLLVNEINSVAKPDALSLFFLTLFLYAINPRSSFQKLDVIQYIAFVSVIGSLLISTKFFGLILLPITWVLFVITLKRNPTNVLKLKKIEKRFFITFVFLVPSLTIIAFMTRLIILGQQKTNEFLTIKWAKVSFGSQQAYSFNLLIACCAVLLIFIVVSAASLYKKADAFGFNEKVLSTLVFTIPITALLNFDGLISFRLIKSLYFFQLKTSNGHFVREKSSWGLTITSWNVTLLVLIVVATIGFYLAGKIKTRAYLFEWLIFLVVILFFSTRTVSAAYLFPLAPFIGLGLTIFVAWTASQGKSNLFWLSQLFVYSILVVVMIANLQLKVMQPQKHNPKVAIGVFLDDIASVQSKIYADAEIYVPNKFNRLTTSWSGKWSDANGADFLMLSGVLIDAYGVIRRETDVVNSEYPQSYIFYTEALGGTKGYCKVGTWKNAGSYSVLLTKEKKLCDNFVVELS